MGFASFTDAPVAAPRMLPVIGNYILDDPRENFRELQKSVQTYNSVRFASFRDAPVAASSMRAVIGNSHFHYFHEKAKSTCKSKRVYTTATSWWCQNCGITAEIAIKTSRFGDALLCRFHMLVLQNRASFCCGKTLRPRFHCGELIRHQPLFGFGIGFL